MTTIDLDKREIKILLDSLKEFRRVYVLRGGSRDFSFEDEHEKLENKLTDCLSKTNFNL